MPGVSGGLPKDFAADVEGVHIDLETRCLTIKRGERHLKLVLGGELAIVALRFVMACEADSRLELLEAREDVAELENPVQCVWCSDLGHRLGECPKLVTSNGGLHQP